VLSKGRWDSGGVTPGSLKLGTRLRSAVRFDRFIPRFQLWQETWRPSNRRLGGTKAGCLREEKVSCSRRKTNPNSSSDLLVARHYTEWGARIIKIHIYTKLLALPNKETHANPHLHQPVGITQWTDSCISTFKLSCWCYKMKRFMQIHTYIPCSCPLISGVEIRPPPTLAVKGAIGRCCWGRRGGRR
jgi:hypothetical protein